MRIREIRERVELKGETPLTAWLAYHMEVCPICSTREGLCPDGKIISKCEKEFLIDLQTSA